MENKGQQARELTYETVEETIFNIFGPAGQQLLTYYPYTTARRLIVTHTRKIKAIHL